MRLQLVADWLTYRRESERLTQSAANAFDAFKFKRDVTYLVTRSPAQARIPPSPTDAHLDGSCAWRDSLKSGGPPEQGAVVARQNCILRTVVGSQLHGLMNEGTDDRDEMAICTRDHELWPNSARITRPLK